MNKESNENTSNTCDVDLSREFKQEDEFFKRLQSLLVYPNNSLVYSRGLWKNLIIDLTLTFLTTNPTDVIAFGFQYFQNLKTKKLMLIEDKERSVKGESVDDDGESSRPLLEGLKTKSEVKERRVPGSSTPPSLVRRKSVFADSVSDEDEIEWKPAIHPKTDEQRRNCRGLMKEVMLFREVAPDDLSVLVDALAYKEVDSGEKIITQGADGDYFYIVDSGLYQAYYTTSNGFRAIAKYNNRGTFGELALMYNVPRTCSVKALTRGGLWALDRDTFKRVVVQSAKRRRSRYMNFMHQVPLMKNLKEYEMLNLADSFQQMTFNVGDCIIKQGDDADGMYFIEKGKVGVSIIDEQGIEIGLHELDVGDYFGELALIEKKPRAATAYAMTEVKVAFLNTEAFERLLGPCRALMERNISKYRNDASFRSKSAISYSPVKPKQSILSKKDGPSHALNVRLASPDVSESGNNESRLPKSTRRSSTSMSRLSRMSNTRSSKFSDRKPSIFQALTEVMSRGDAQ